MIRFGILTISIVLTATAASAQSSFSLQQLWQEYYGDEYSLLTDDADQDYALEELQSLADHPISINTATRQQLLALPFLDERQVADILSHIARYGAMQSIQELRMIPSLDYRQLALLPFFVYADGQAVPPALPDSVRPIRHKLMLTGRIPFYRHRGDVNGYTGYKYRHSMRYLAGNEHIRWGMVGSQDAGEPFFSNKNSMGYDHYTAYLQYQGKGLIEDAIAGCFRIAEGMGLTMNGRLLLGKQTAEKSYAGSRRIVRPAATRSTDGYFQGAAVTLAPLQRLRICAFGSYRAVDASLDSAGNATSISTAGYHRTLTELSRKNNTHLAEGGLVSTLDLGGMKLGGSTIFSSLDRRLSPRTSATRRNLHGQTFMASSVSASYMHHYFSLAAETAVNEHGHAATLLSGTAYPLSALSISATARSYDSGYATLHARSFSDGGHVQNERGLCLGADYHPGRQFFLRTYVDRAFFPQPRYQASRPSHSWDFFGESSLRLNESLSLRGRYRLRASKRDNTAKTALIDSRQHRARLALDYVSSLLSASLQADYAVHNYKTLERGFMISSRVRLQADWFTADLFAAGFHTQGYNSRIFVYEPQMLYDFSFPAYYGRGMRIVQRVNCQFNRIQLSLRTGLTHYADRQSVGSGLQTVPHSTLVDADCQLVFKF